MNIPPENADVERTFALIKPDVVDAHMGKILDRIQVEGFRICDMVLELEPSRVFWRAFYAEHEGKPFYDDLCGFMASGAVLAMVLARPDAVAHWRSVIGLADARYAAPGTLRRLYGEDVGLSYGGRPGLLFRNAVHGSDSEASAQREAAMFFRHGLGR